MLRQHRLRAPLVVGLVALRGRAPAQHPANPIRCIALCVGGSHAIVYQPDFNLHRKHIGGPLVFDGDNNMKRVQELLCDKRVTVACVGAAEVAEKLAEQWGLYVARPAELTDLFARAYGKAAGVDPLQPARKLASQGTPSESGWIPKAIDGLCMEYMARVALGSEMRLAPTPKKVAAADWGGRDLGCDEWMYATRDAYLCFDIAAHCLPKLGACVG